MIRIAVVLPAPLGPIRPTTWPRGMENETPRRAWTAPKCFVRSRTSIMVSAMERSRAEGKGIGDRNARGWGSVKPGPRGAPAGPAHYHGRQSPGRLAMKYALISIVLGLLGGVAGAFGARALLDRETPGRDGRRRSRRRAHPRGAPRPAGGGPGGPRSPDGPARGPGRRSGPEPARLTVSEEVLDRYEEVLAKRLEPRVKSQVEQAVKDLKEKRGRGRRAEGGAAARARSSPRWPGRSG